jgi:hypothetical protein
MSARRVLAALTAALVAAACGGDSGPSAGTLEVTLSGAAPARAVKFRLVGPTTGIAEPGTGPVLAADDAGKDTLVVAVIAPVGATLNGAAVARISVPDVGAAASYSATVLEVAAPSYALQSASQYSLSVARP